MVFRPTWEEFQNFPEYVKYMEKCGAHLGGLAKVNFFIYTELRSNINHPNPSADHPAGRVDPAQIRLQLRRHQHHDQEPHPAVRHGQAGILPTVQRAEEADVRQGVLPQGLLRALRHAEVLRLRGPRAEVLEECHLHPAHLW